MAWIGAVDNFEFLQPPPNIEKSISYKSVRTFDEEEIQGTCGCLWKSKGSNKKAQKERIKQFSIWFEEKDLARQKVFAKRRFDREFQREVKRRRVRCIRKLFIPTALCWIVGFGITLASTVRSLGEGTVFWNYREDFIIAGPSILGAGLVLLMITEGLISDQQIKIKKLETRDREFSIEVNGSGNTEKKTGKQGQETLKTISRKLPLLHPPRRSVDKETETDSFLFMESEQIVRSETIPQITRTQFLTNTAHVVSNTPGTEDGDCHDPQTNSENDCLLLGATSKDYDDIFKP